LLLLAGTLAGVGVVLAVEALRAQPVLAQGVAQKRIAPAAPGRGAAGAELSGPLLYEFLVAEIALQRDQPQLAAQTWLDLAKKTRDARFARRATEVAWRARMPQVALEAVRIWTELEPESGDAGAWRLQILVATNRLQEAQPGLEALLARDASDRTFMQIARRLGEVKDKAAALKMMRELAAPYRDNAAAHQAVGLVAAAAGQDELALAEARAAGVLKPDWEAPVLLEAQVLARREDASAIERLRQFIDAHPQAADVRLAYARALAAARQVEPARREFAKLAETFPDNSDVVYPAAILSLQLDDFPAAERYLRQLVELDFADMNLVYLYLGQAIEEQKRPDEALDWYRKVGPGEQQAAARLRIAFALSKAGKLDEALASLREPKPENMAQRVQLVLTEAQLLRDARRIGEALDTIAAALVRMPDQADLLYEQGMLAERAERFDLMESALRRVIAVKPDQAQAYNALGYSLADRGQRLPEARQLIERAARLAPDDFFILDSLGWVLFRQGDLQGALKALERAYAGQADGEIAAHLGEVFWALGRQADAERVWAEAAGRSPGNETLEKTVRRLRGGAAVLR
jgi:tetratricopeptide (TPR) repeat protein